MFTLARSSSEAEPLALNQPPPICARLLALSDRDPRRAVPLARRALDNYASADPRCQAWATFTLGRALLRWERLDEAQTRLAQAEASFTSLDLPIPALHAHFGQLIVAALHGTGAKLQQDFTDLAMAFEHYDRPLEAARVRIRQIGHMNVLGVPRDALALAAQIAPQIAQHGTPADQAWLDLVTGIAYGNMGSLPHAAQYLDRAAQLFTAARQPFDAAKARFERAWITQRQEQFALAMAELEQIRPIFQRQEMPLRLAFWEKQAGLIAARLGRYDQAIAWTLQARARFAAMDRGDRAADCDLNLGIIAYYSGLFDLSLAAYRRAQHVYEGLGMQQMALISQRNQAMVLRAQGQPAASLAQFTQLVTPVTALGERMELAEIMVNQGQALRDLHDYAAAYEHFRNAESLFLDLGNSAAAAESRLEQGWLALDQHDLPTAQDCFTTAHATLLDRPVHQWRAAYGLGRCAELLGQPKQALEHYRQASSTVARLRQRLASEHASSGIFAQARQLFTDALALAWQQHDPYAVLELTEQQRAVALQRQLLYHPQPVTTSTQDIDQQQAQLRTILAAASTSSDLDAALTAYTDLLLRSRHLQPLPADLPLTGLDLAALRRDFNRAYPAGWDVLACVPCGEAILQVCFDSHNLTLSATPMDQRLRFLLERACLPRFRQLTYLDLARLNGQTTQPWAVLTELGTRLIPSDLRARLHPDRRLLIVPCASLHSLPWAALRLEETWLAAKATVQLLPGLLLWPTLAQRPLPGPAAFALGCSQFGDRADDLPSVRHSLDLIDRCWPGTVTRHEEATRQEVLDRAQRGELQNYGLLHIATHGQLLAAQGLLAHLKLADDDLFYADIAGLKLAGSLVVLAACDGAAGEVLLGEEVVSLSRAWLVAGARDVIASQWQLYDNALLHILEPLYAALAAGHDAPSALAYAQRTLIAQELPLQDSRAVFTSPLVWSSLCAIGAGSNVSLSE